MDPALRASLETERDFLLRSLEDLEAEHAAGDIAADDYVSLYDDYTRRAAEVLRALGHDDEESLPPRRSLGLKVIAGLMAVVLLAVAVGWVLALNAGTRLPGDSATGDVAASVNGLLAEARVQSQSDPATAIRTYDEALALDPTNPEALTYKGWLLVRVGAGVGAEQADAGVELINSGRSSLDAAVESNPQYADARALRGIVAYSIDADPAEAQEQFDVLFSLGNLDPTLVQLVTPVDEASRADLGLAPR